VPTFASGTRLGPYEIIELLGAGAMGEVYRARDTRLDRDVAIKILPHALAADPARLQRFEHEARAAAALNHPNILAVYDVGQEGGAPYIVSEYLRGRTLRERLEDTSMLPVKKAVTYAVQIATGLAAAHEHGIVHRDLKPENLFITSDDRLKILDFGIAKLTEAEGPSSSTVKTVAPGTQPGFVIGTVGYMAPEQIRGLAADRRSDIFSFGAVLYEMLCGRRAFTGTTNADVMTAILKEDPPDLTVVEPRVPPILGRVVERCLEKSPVDRFQSTEDLAFALEGLAASADTGSVTPHATEEPMAARKWPYAAAAVAVLLVLGVVATTYLRLPSSSIGVIRLPVPPPRGAATITPATDMMSLSPDGKRLLFPAASGDGTERLWVRSLNAIDALPIAGTESGTYPFWSPDGRSIGFFAEGKLKKIDAAGGSPTTLVDAPQPAGATWSANGVIVFSSAGRLHRISSAGGSAAPLLGANEGRTGSTFANPTFLPDGRHLLYLDTGSGGVNEGAIYAGSIDSRERTVVLKTASNVSYGEDYLFFLRDTTLMAQPFNASRLALTGDALPVAEQIERASGGAARGAFAVADRVLAYQANEGGPRVATNLTWIDRAGIQTGTVGDRGDYGDVTLSPDGSRAAVSVLESLGGRDVWIFDVARGVSTRFTFDAKENLSSTWSPDGSRIAFSSRRNGHDDVFVKPSSGGGADQPLLVDNFDKLPMDWSPDGRSLLFANGNLSIVGSRGSLWILPLAGGKKPYSILDAPSFSQTRGQFSPDGKWLAYASNESGRFEIYAVSFPGQDHKARISTAGGNWPRWRRDGKELFYLTTPPDEGLHAAAIGVRGGNLIVGEDRTLFQVRWRNGVRYPYDASPDGQRFLFALLAEAQQTSPITLVVNWPSELKH
jgi:serine/threonine protein kinase